LDQTREIGAVIVRIMPSDACPERDLFRLAAARLGTD
jgi:hypothetical protein